MKIIISCLFVIALLLAAPHAIAQKPMPKDGYWVVEKNINIPKQATVYFYNNQHQLVYKESISNIELDITKARVRRQLNSVLDQSIIAWKREKGLLLASRMQ